MGDQSQQTGQSEYPSHSNYPVSVWFVWHKEYYKTHYHQNCIDIVPSIHKKDLGTVRDDSDHQLYKEYPYEYIVESFEVMRVAVHEKDSIDER